MKKLIGTLTGVLLVLVALTGPRVAAQDIRRSLTTLTNALVKLADGSASAPSLAFTSEPTLGFSRRGSQSIDFNAGSQSKIAFSSNTVAVQSGGSYNWSSSATDAGGAAADLSLVRDAANILAQRNGTNPQALRVYGTYTDASNYERMSIGPQVIRTEQAGTGVARAAVLGTSGNASVYINTNGTDRWFFSSTGDITPVADNTYNIGVGAFRPKDYLGTGKITSAGATSGVGYATGAGGAITQITSRVTGVTLNTVTGDITLVSAAGSATPATFIVTDSAVAVTDNIVINQKSGTDLYNILVTNVAAGSFKVTFFTTGGVTVEQPVFHFSVVKGVSS